MEDLNDKATSGQLTAAQWNQAASEVQAVIEGTGQTLSGLDLAQLAKGVVAYAGAGTFYADSGVADAYVLNVVGGKEGPAQLDADTDGLLCRFRPGNASTGASTVNVNALGAKTLTREDGSAIQANDLATTRDAVIRYDQSADQFRLLNFTLTGPQVLNTYDSAESSSNTGGTVEGALTASLTVPATGNYVIEVELTIHYFVQSAAAGAEGEVIAAISQDIDAGGVAIVRSTRVNLQKNASGNDDTELRGALFTKYVLPAPVNGSTYDFAADLTIFTDGAGADAALDADNTAGVQRIHSIVAKLVQTS